MSETVSNREIYEGLKRLGFKDSPSNLKAVLSLWVSHGLLLPALQRGRYSKENLERLAILEKYPVMSIAKDGELSYPFLASLLAVNGIWNEDVKRLTVEFIRPYTVVSFKGFERFFITRWMTGESLIKVDEDYSFFIDENTRKKLGEYVDLKDYEINLGLLLPTVKKVFRNEGGKKFPTKPAEILERIEEWENTQALSFHFRVIESVNIPSIVTFLHRRHKNDNKTYLKFLVITLLISEVFIQSLNSQLKSMVETFFFLSLANAGEMTETILRQDGIIGISQLTDWKNAYPEIYGNEGISTDISEEDISK